MRNIGVKTVNYTSLPRALWSNLRQLDLSNNPYVCDCQLVWFQRWLMKAYTTSTTVIGLYDPTAYRCSYPVEDAGKSIIGLGGRMPKLNALTCFKSPPDWCLGQQILFAIVTSLVSFIVSIVHRYRWHVRHWQFALQVIGFTNLYNSYFSKSYDSNYHHKLYNIIITSVVHFLCARTNNI